MNAESPVLLVLDRGVISEDELPEILDGVRYVQWGHRPYSTPMFYPAGPDCPHQTADPDHPEHLNGSWPDGDSLCMLRPAGDGCSECESDECAIDARRSWLADDITALWWLVSDADDTPRNEGAALAAATH
jgi:hypothetical protein